MRKKLTRAQRRANNINQQTVLDTLLAKQNALLCQTIDEVISKGIGREVTEDDRQHIGLCYTDFSLEEVRATLYWAGEVVGVLIERSNFNYENGDMNFTVDFEPKIV